MYSVFAKLMEERGITSYRVSKDTGISQSILSAWKNGNSTPKMDKMQTLADYFGVSLNYLLGKEEETICPVCGYTFNPTSEDSVSNHIAFHKRYFDAFDIYGNHFITYEMQKSNMDSEKEIFYSEIYPDNLRDRYLDSILSSMFTGYVRNNGLSLTEDFEKFARQAIPELNKQNPIKPYDYKKHIYEKYGISIESEAVDSTTGKTYYFDDETAEYAQRIYENPELRALFDAADGVPKNVLVSVYNLLMSMKQKEKGEMGE